MRRARVIVNPAAGAGRTERLWPDAIAALRDAGIDPDFVSTEAPGQATELAAAAARDGVDLVVAMGGDGTAHEVANGLLRHPSPPPLGLIQTGTGRDLSRVLKLPRGVKAQARLLARVSPLKLDVGWCRYQGPQGPERAAFLLVGGVGFNTRVIRRAARWKRLGRTLPYFLASLAEWWSVAPIPTAVTLDGALERLQITDLQVLNVPWVGGGMYLAPGADPQDGWLEALIVQDQSRWRLLNLLMRLYTGSHIGCPGVRYGTTRQVRVAPDDPQLVSLDGELVGQTPAEFSIAREALAVLAKEVRVG